jgi:hypothetical protein
MKKNLRILANLQANLINISALVLETGGIAALILGAISGNAHLASVGIVAGIFGAAIDIANNYKSPTQRLQR